ncbi:MAG: acetylornithine deacetylase [Cardiobacteriaceae bacterium]|nr:acetylornithine deacetylase [Cardiobacteriaceae bacterium]
MQKKSLKIILERLISFNTISDLGNIDLIKWIEDFLSKECKKNLLFWRIPDATNPEKSSLLVQFAGKNNAQGKGIVFSGHSDVVPVVGQNWTTDAFVMDERDGKYFGRGVCDMKGFIAVLLAILPEFAAAELKKPIYLAISYDEETDCDKAQAIVEKMREIAADKSLVIVGEPSSLRAVVAQKGIVNMQTDFFGKAAHSSQILQQGCSAIYAAGEFVVDLEKLLYSYAENPLPSGYSTINIGKIYGGTAHNILANKCTIEWEIRTTPEQNIEEILTTVDAIATQQMQKQPLLKIATYPTTDFVPPLINRDNQEILDLVAEFLADKNYQQVAYATEAGHFQQAGMPTIILGPGDIAQAHQEDEWIEIAELEQACDLYRSVIRKYCL